MKKINVAVSILTLAILMPLAVQSAELEEIKGTSLKVSFDQAEATQEQKLVEPNTELVPAKSAEMLPPGFLPKDAFKGLEACRIVDARFIVRPTLQSAVKLLRPCMAAVSLKYRMRVSVGTTGLSYSLPAGINIFVVGIMPFGGSWVVADLNHSVDKRGGSLLSYRTKVIYLGETPLATLSIDEVALQLEEQIRLRGIFVMVKILESLPPQLLIIFPSHDAFDRVQDLFPIVDSNGNLYYEGFKIVVSVPK